MLCGVMERCSFITDHDNKPAQPLHTAQATPLPVRQTDMGG